MADEADADKGDELAGAVCNTLHTSLDIKHLMLGAGQAVSILWPVNARKSLC